MKKIIALFSLFFIFHARSADEKQKIILDHLFAQTTKHIFNVDDQSFLLNMAHNQDGLHYRAVYPFAQIEQAGAFKLSTKVTNKITIKASDVSLDLNGNTVTGGIEINAGLENVTIKNGTVDTTVDDGILVHNGCTDIAIKQVSVRNAIRGIHLDGVENSIISSCDMSRNTTGIELTTCSNIVMQDCTARCNTNAGFCFITSTTCSVINCKALSTGEGNVNETQQTIVGFIASDGNGNTFQGCIANGTQGLATTDFESIIAGFVLRGTEGCSSIIECQATNATSNATGLTVPYGIYLPGLFVDETLTLTAKPEIPEIATSVASVDWNANGERLLVGLSDDEEVAIYEYDYLNFTATRIASISGAIRATWHPNDVNFAGQFGTGSSITFDVFQFNSFNNTISSVATSPRIFGASTLVTNPPDWNPDGQHLTYATGISSGAGELYVDVFNPIDLTLSTVTSFTSIGNATFAKWHPNGQLLMFGDTGQLGGPPFGVIRLLKFINDTLVNVDNSQFEGFAQAGVNDGAWRSDGNFFAATDQVNERIGVWRLESDNTLTRIISSNTGVSDPIGAVWSDDGNYLAVGGIVAGVTVVRVFFVDLTNATLTTVATSNFATSTTSNLIQAVNWSPEGSLIAAGSEDEGLFVYKALHFPSNNVLKSNITSCNSGGNAPFGVGIGASGIANTVLGNTAFSNPIGGSSLLNTNYAFVTNVFNQEFGNAPTALQNLSSNFTDPLQTPDDINIRLVRSLSKACDIQTKVDILLAAFG